MYEDIIELKGKEAGPTSMILVGVHGNEICGIKAIEKILPTLQIEKGKVFVAYGNPEAIKKNVRFTEANLNRMFKPDEMLSVDDKQSYEYGRAQFLKKYFDQSEALLDIHASFTPTSQTFIICEKNSENIVKYLPFTLLVSGFDQVEPGGTDYYMNKTGRIGICVECGYLGNPISSRIATESIMSFLCAQGHILGSKSEFVQSHIAMKSIYITKSNFKLAKAFADFEEIKIGQQIGVDGEESVLAKTDGVILFARDVYGGNEEAFLFGEKKEA